MSHVEQVPAAELENAGTLPRNLDRRERRAGGLEDLELVAAQDRDRARCPGSRHRGIGSRVARGRSREAAASRPARRPGTAAALSSSVLPGRGVCGSHPPTLPPHGRRGWRLAHSRAVRAREPRVVRPTAGQARRRARPWVQHAARVAVAGEAVVAQRVVRGARRLARVRVAGEAVRLRSGRARGRRSAGKARRLRSLVSSSAPNSTASARTHSRRRLRRAIARMVPCLAMRGLLRDTVLLVVATLILGTAANLVPGRQLAWWGKGFEPPRIGVDFNFLDPGSADAMRTSLPGVVFLDTRSADRVRGRPRARRRGDLLHGPAGRADARASRAPALGRRGHRLRRERRDRRGAAPGARSCAGRGSAPPYVLIGGFLGWQGSGLPVDGGTP